MPVHPTSVRTSAVALCALLSACSEPKQLSDYSTEEIVTEYHGRLDNIFEKTAEPVRQFVGLDTKPGKRSAEQLEERRKAMEEQAKAIRYVVEELRPYADAGNVQAVVPVGHDLLFGPDKTRSERCEGLKLLKEAAMQGYPSAAFSLHAHFETRRFFSDDEHFAKLSYFWASEAARYVPAYKRVVDVFDVIWPEEKMAEWSEAVQNWTPGEDKSLQNEIRLMCASVERESG